jgi:GTP-binding protein
MAAHSPRQWPPDRGMEVAFAGRSNVGKSSAINAITRRKSLARTSGTPGRTQQITFFDLDATRRLVDLPGYGYARVPLKLRRHWAETIERFLKERKALRGLVLVMDARHPLTALDRQMLSWCATAGLRVHILLTKFDKLGSGRGSSALKAVDKEVSSTEGITVQAFSALDSTGVAEAREHIAAWLGAIPAPGSPERKSPGTKR